MINLFERFIQLIEPNSTPTLEFANYLDELNQQINRSTVLTGNGSPEGAAEGLNNQMYRDTSAGPGSNLYIKTTEGGNTGWQLV